MRSGTRSAGRRGRGRMGVGAAILALLVMVVLDAGSARAAACDTSWNGSVNNDWFTDGNWDHGVPDEFENACITNPASAVEISGDQASAESLTISGGELDITGFFDGANHHDASLYVSEG